ncbi:hypothetical protein DB88DRAFT_517610 [Papiliotrema laurentii]|uniref:Uncharacterized protein n=1 Tax=Papiliotrema laurentii TaxID=5418 RepID=A0AAD9CW55_PAPLA|nr:hypothetical protein DB88DRAFT_517610 [Papiliotrema laurentii]
MTWQLNEKTSSFGSGHFGAPALVTHPTRKQPVGIRAQSMRNAEFQSRAASLKPPGFYFRPVDYGLDDGWHPHDEGPNTYKAGKGSKPSSSSTDPPEAKGSVREGCTTSAGNVPRLQAEWYRWAAEQLKSYKRSPAQKDLTGSFLVGDTRYYPATSAYAPQSAPYGSRGPGATDSIHQSPRFILRAQTSDYWERPPLEVSET